MKTLGQEGSAVHFKDRQKLSPTIFGLTLTCFSSSSVAKIRIGSGTGKIRLSFLRSKYYIDMTQEKKGRER